MRSIEVPTKDTLRSIHWPSCGSSSAARPWIAWCAARSLAERLSQDTTAIGPASAARRAARPTTSLAAGEAGTPTASVSKEPAAKAARRVSRSAATVSSAASKDSSGPRLQAASVIVSVTTAVDGAASSSHRRRTSSAARGSLRAPMISGSSDSGPRTMRVNSPSWADSRSDMRGERPVKDAKPHCGSEGSASECCVYQNWCARWNAPSPRCTMRTGAAGACGWVVRFSGCAHTA